MLCQCFFGSAAPSCDMLGNSKESQRSVLSLILANVCRMPNAIALYAVMAWNTRSAITSAHYIITYAPRAHPPNLSSHPCLQLRLLSLLQYRVIHNT
jgi:hypothetical protein